MTNILVINCGSSSVKYSLIDVALHEVRAKGVVEKIGERQSSLKHRYRDDSGTVQEIIRSDAIVDHRSAFEVIFSAMKQSALLENPGELFAIGHRVVHGGEAFSDPTIIDEDVLLTIKRTIPLAPLHNPANLVGIETTREAMPDVPQVAVFDTAFHQTLPPQAFLYALPYELYTKFRIRRYGFHGTSHAYLVKQAARHLQKTPSAVNLITLHLGNGASACAVRAGKSIDTSMGMTPLEGLVMGTRSGDVDPGVLFHLSSEAGYSIKELDSLLNTQSGLKGISGVNDMREISRLAHDGDKQAQLALDITSYRIKKYIGAYYAVLGRLDAVVFSAGVGENAPGIRAESCRDLKQLGIDIDPVKNTEYRGGIAEIQNDESRVRILVIPTDEELEIAEASWECVRSRQQ